MARKKPVRRSKKPRRASRPTVVIPSRQLRMPAGFMRSGDRPATLADVLSPRVPTIDGAQLDDTQRAALTVLRIERQKHFAIASIRHGLIDKARAIEEVRQGSPLGRALVEIEQIAIDFMRQEHERRRKRTRVRRRRSARRK